MFCPGGRGNAFFSQFLHTLRFCTPQRRLVLSYTRGRCYLQHVGCLLAPLGHVLRLGQQVIEEARLVELADQLALETVLDVVDQEVHHCLGHAMAEEEEERSVENDSFMIFLYW